MNRYFKKLIFILCLFNFQWGLSQTTNCFGVEVVDYDDSIRYADLRPWIDTAADSSHVPMVRKCEEINNCFRRFGFGISPALVNAYISKDSLHKLAKIWANDLNSSFEFKTITQEDPFMTKRIFADSSYDYNLGPYLWITKAEVLAISKKCYVLRFGYEDDPVHLGKSISPKKISGKLSAEPGYNSLGQKITETQPKKNRIKSLPQKTYQPK